MTIIKGSGGGGLLFRNGGGTDLSGFGYKFRLFQDHVDLLYGNISLCSSTALKAQLDQTYILTAIARRHTINVYIDKQSVCSVEDNESSSGTIGFAVYGPATELVFRNAKVWRLGP